MLYLKKIKKYYFNYFIWLFGLLIVMTLLSYFNIISQNIIKILKLIIPILLIGINSLKSAKKIKIKGYLNGILYSGLIIISLFILNLIFIRRWHIKQVLYDLILIFTSILGSMIGKNKKSQLFN